MRLKILVLLLTSNLIYAGDKVDAQIELSDSNISLNKQFQKCVSYIDMGAIQYFESKGLRLTRDIRLLCSRNDRNKAQNIAIGFSMEVQSSKEMLAFKQCSKIVTESKIELRKTLKTYFISDLRFKHICD